MFLTQVTARTESSRVAGIDWSGSLGLELWSGPRDRKSRAREIEREGPRLLGLLVRHPEGGQREAARKRLGRALRHPLDRQLLSDGRPGARDAAHEVRKRAAQRVLE